MIKSYQKDWHGIEFSQFAKCDVNNIAGKDFYDKFYETFFEKFKSFNDLEKKWITYKNQIAKVILNEINSKKNILSIGCGIGIVEKYLIEHSSKINLTAVEPSPNVSRWVKNLDRINIKDGYFPDVLDPKLKFDIAYANGVDYVFNNAEYQVFLKSIVDYGIKELLIISVSYYTPSFKLYFKAIVKNILIKMKLYRGRQFWGFNRSIKEQFGAIKKSGFKNISLVYKSDSTIVIKAKT